MLNGGNFDETRRHTVKLTLDALTYSLLSFLFGLAFFSIKNAKILFTDISIPSPLFQVLSILYFLLFIVFSASLLLPTLMEFIEQLLDWVASSVLWHILAAILFFLTVAFTLSSLVRGTVTFPATIFSLSVEYIAAGWLAYVAIIMVIDMVKPDWREAIGNLSGGAAAKNSDYLTRQIEKPDDRPAAVATESEGTKMRANYLGGGEGGGINWAFLLTGVLTVVIAGAFGYYYWQTTNTIAARNSTIGNQTVQIAQLTNDLETERANSISLSGQLTAANAQIVSLTTQKTTLQTQAATLQTQTATLQSQISSLQDQLNTANAQVTSNAAILALSASTTEASSSVTVAQNTLSPIASFTAAYPGYIIVSGTNTSTSGFITVNDSNSYYPSYWNSYQYGFGSGTTLYIPVLPGSINVNFETSDSAGATAIISVMYYY